MAAYTVTQADFDLLTNNDVEMVIDGNVASVGSTAEKGGYSGGIYAPPSEIVLTAQAGTFVSDSVYFEGWAGGLFKKLSFIISGDSLTASLTLEEDIENRPLSLQVETAAPSIALTLNQDDIDVLNSNDVTAEIDNVQLGLDDDVLIGTTLKLLAGEGRIFIIGEVYIDGYWGQDNLYNKEEFTVSEDGKIAELLIETEYGSGRFPITCATEQVSEIVSGTNNVYLIDQDKLKTLNSQRFQFTTENQEVDYGLYILSLLELPFEISEEMILEPENIYLAERDTGILANKIASDKIILDLGIIEIPETENNMLDYLGVEVTLYLPRLSPMPLDLNMVIGETIGIQYIIDCYTGNATVNITSSKIGGYTIETKTVDLGVNIPYALTTLQNTMLENTSIEVGGDNGILTPFIEVSRKQIILEDGFFTVPVSDEGTLLNQTGYIEVENVEINGRLSKSENDSLLNYLLNGVIINE